MSKLLCTMVVTLLISPACLQAQDSPLQPTEEMARYQLSNIRNETDNFGRSVLAIDWTRTKEGTGSPRFSGKTKNGPLSITFGPNLRGESGTARFRSFGPFGNNTDVEFWIASRGPAGLDFMLSNAIRTGNPGPATTARAMSDKDREAIERAKLAATPPAALPSGYEAVTNSTKLMPGMPVKAGWMAEWEDAEVLSLNKDGNVTLLYPQQRDTIMPRSRKDWIAVEPAVLAKAEANPDAFKPSRQVLPNSRLVVPEDAVVIPADKELPKGTPVLVDYKIKWHEAFIVRDMGDEIEIRYKGWDEKWDKKYPRSGSLIKQGTLEDLDDPKMVERFANNVKAGRQTKVKDYPIRGSIPNDAQLVPEELEVPDGAELGAYWGNRFYKMTLLSSNDDGTLHVRWNDFGKAWDCDMTRDQLIIAKTEAKKLERQMKTPEKETTETVDNGEKPRTWKDASGDFSIKATFVKEDDGVVVLKTSDGEEMEIELDQLSRTDQLYIESMPKKTANPFRKRN